MGVAPRDNKAKATKVIWSILGKPANIAAKPTKKQKEIDERLRALERMKLR